MLSAVKEGKLEAFRALIQNESVNFNKESLLHWATLGRKVEMVDALITAGADVNWPGLHDGQTPLYIATSVIYTDLVGRLLRAGANPNLGKLSTSRTTGISNSPVEVLTSPLLKAIELGGVEAAKLLLEAGADVNQGDQDGYTALTLATEKGDEAMVRLLLKYGASIEVCGQTGRSVYEMATKESIRKMLVAHRPGQTEQSDTGNRPHGWSFFGLFRRRETAAERAEREGIVHVSGVKGNATATTSTSTHQGQGQGGKGAGSITAPTAVLGTSVASNGNVPPVSAQDVGKQGYSATHAPPAVASAVLSRTAPLSSSSYNGSFSDHSSPPPIAVGGLVGQAIRDNSADLDALRRQLAAMERVLTEQARVIERQGKDIALLKSQVNL